MSIEFWADLNAYRKLKGKTLKVMAPNNECMYMVIWICDMHCFLPLFLDWIIAIIIPTGNLFHRLQHQYQG